MILAWRLSPKGRKRNPTPSSFISSAANMRKAMPSAIRSARSKPANWSAPRPRLRSFVGTVAFEVLFKVRPAPKPFAYCHKSLAPHRGVSKDERNPIHFGRRTRSGPKDEMGSSSFPSCIARKGSESLQRSNIMMNMIIYISSLLRNDNEKLTVPFLLQTNGDSYVLLLNGGCTLRH
jgi:hypothetical protein